jgi:hypothetical protein
LRGRVRLREESTMKRATAIGSMMLAGLFGVAVIGCDEKISEERKVDVKDNGTVVDKKTTVTEKADGSIEQTKSKEVSKPDETTTTEKKTSTSTDKDTEVKVKVDKD